MFKNISYIIEGLTDLSYIHRWPNFSENIAAYREKLTEHFTDPVWPNCRVADRANGWCTL